MNKINHGIIKRIKRFFKELKRVRWPQTKDTNSAFLKSIIFVIISALVLFGVAIAFTWLWQWFGIGL